MNESSKDRTPEKVQVVPLNQIDDFPDHPFLVKDDDSMDQLVHSIEMNGVLNPVIARQKEDGRFELISGHRRKHACEKLGVEQIPVIVRDLSRDEAIIEMVDSNLQREHILPFDELREHLDEVDPGKPVYVICQSGLRSYISCRILEGNGYTAYNFAGGFRFYQAVMNDRALKTSNSLRYG